MAAFKVLFRTISSCLSYLEGDEATFSSVHACFVAIKYHLKTLDHTVKEGLSLNDDDIERMTLLTHHCLATIYSEAQALAFVTDPMFTEMRMRIGAEFGEVFLPLGKTSINHLKPRLHLLVLLVAMTTFVVRCSVNSLLISLGAMMIQLLMTRACLVTSKTL